MSGKSFIGSAKIIGLCTLISRVLGMIRDILCARIFGAGMVWDAFAIAFLIPNLFRRFFGEGAMTAAFVPVFVHTMEREGKESAFRLINIIFTIVAAILAAITIVGIAATYILPSVAGGEKLRLICDLLAVMMPYLILICLAAILGGALNSMRHFTAPAAAPIILNVVWIAALLALTPIFGLTARERIFAVAWAILLGGVLELAVQLLPLSRMGARVRFEYAPKSEGVKEVVTLFIPVVFGLSLVQINELVDNLVAEACVAGHGAVSALYYGNRVMQLPLAVIGTAFATAVFPLLTSSAAAQRTEDFVSLFKKSLRLCLFIAIPAGTGLIVLAEPIVRLLFERGDFTPANTERVAGVLMLYALGIWCFSCNQIVVRAFYARKDMKTPVKVSAAMVLLNFTLNVILVWPLREGGIALATSISGFLSLAILMALLRRKYDIPLRDIVVTLIRSALISLAMGAVCGLIYYKLAPLLGLEESGGIFQAIVLLGATILCGALFYLGAAKLFGMRELNEWRGKESFGHSASSGS